MHFISNTDVQIATDVLKWMEKFLVEPNPMMKRSHDSSGEAVCPFVKPLLQGNSLYLAFHHEVNGKNPHVVEQLVLQYRDPFRKAPPYRHSDRLRKSLAVVFPAITAADAPVLDVLHQSIKTEFVQEGLMVAQFYPESDGRSVHSPALRVYTAPFSFMAMRYMAIHDILFLEENETWFAAYDQRFGMRFREPETLEDFEKPLLNVYRKAKARYVK